MAQVLPFPARRGVPSLVVMESDEGAEYALRLGSVLTLLRAVSGWSQAYAEERMDLPTGKLGRWERGDFPPKAYELGAIFEQYEPFGADLRWFLWPPSVDEQAVIRARLDAAVRAGTTAADDAEARAQLRRLRAASRPGAVRGKRPA